MGIDTESAEDLEEDDIMLTSKELTTIKNLLEKNAISNFNSLTNCRNFFEKAQKAVF